jgi:hypothetical protein
MDATVRGPLQARVPLLQGGGPPLRGPDRPARDERIDVPEVGESGRVSFGDGVAVRPGFPARGGADRYRVLQEDAERAAGRAGARPPAAVVVETV